MIRFKHGRSSSSFRAMRTMFIAYWMLIVGVFILFIYAGLADR